MSLEQSQVVTYEPAEEAGRAEAEVSGWLARWRLPALGLIALLAGLLNLLWLSREGYSNLYYAATVRSMLTSWHNFFYASYDPGGFVTVDKPPLGFWAQAASAWLLGFSGLSLLLPQALAGVLSVLVLYRLVGRAFGPAAGLLAALMLAVAPINVATNRNNTVDALLVLVLLLAAWASAIAAERGRLRWLLLAMALVGLGFNIKMLQAYLVLPAFYVLYLVAAPLPPLRRAGHLALATVVLLAVSFSWAAAVELTPPEQRPYVGGSKTNSVFDLALNYNGVERLLGLGGLGGPGLLEQAPAGTMPLPAGGPGGCPPAPAQPQSGPQCFAMPMGAETGNPGPLRLVNEQLAGQIGWLLPLALLGLLAAAARRYPADLAMPSLAAGAQGATTSLWRRLLASRLALARQHQALLLWGAWLLVQAVFFSVAGFWHRYYLSIVSPAVAALAAIGIVTLWRDYRAGGWRAVLLPAALLGLAGFQAWLLAPYPDWNRRLTPAVVALAVLGAWVLLLARPSLLPGLGRATPLAAALGVLGLLLAPAVWGGITVWNAPGDMLPAAGPRTLPGGAGGFQLAFGGPGGPPAPNAIGGVPGGPLVPPDAGGPRQLRIGLGDPQADPRLVSYLRANRGGARFLVATPSSADASPLILATGEPVMALGGFGGDQILDQAALAKLVQAGVVRFFMVPGDDMLMPPGAPGGAGGGQPGGPPPGGAPRLFGPGASLAGEGTALGWVVDHCRPVPEERWRSPDYGQPNIILGGAIGSELYDCAGAQ